MRKKDQNNGGKKRSDISFQRHSQKQALSFCSVHIHASLSVRVCMRLSKCITLYKHIKKSLFFYVPVDKVCQFLLFLSTSDILPISIFNLQNNVSKHAYTLTYTHIPLARTYTHARVRARAKKRKSEKFSYDTNAMKMFLYTTHYYKPSDVFTVCLT